MKSLKLGFARIVSIIAVIALALSVDFAPASAAITPPATPFPNALGSTLSSNLGFVGKIITADASSPAVRIGPYTSCTLQYVTVAGTANATTIKVQGSNIPGVWDDYVFNVITGATTSQSGYYGFNVPTFEYARVFIDVTNANSLTVNTALFCK